MSAWWSPLRWWARLKRAWLLYHLGDPAFRFMFEAPPPNEWVALDCETTGLNVRSDEIISIGAVRIHRLREAHDALNDAVMAGLAFIKLRQLRKD